MGIEHADEEQGGDHDWRLVGQSLSNPLEHSYRHLLSRRSLFSVRENCRTAEPQSPRHSEPVNPTAMDLPNPFLATTDQ